MAIVSYSMEEIANFPKMTDEEEQALLDFEDEDISDCPELTPEQLAKFRPFREFLAEREKTRLEAERKVA